MRSGVPGVEKGSAMHENRQQEAATCAHAIAACGDALLDQRRLAMLQTGARRRYNGASQEPLGPG